MIPVLTIVTVAAYESDRLKTTLESMHYFGNKIEHLIVIPKNDYISLKIIIDYSRTLQGIRVLHDDNTGVYSAMNYGIQESQGEYIVFWNAGERLVSVEKMIKVLKKIDDSQSDIFLVGWKDQDGNKIPNQKLIKDFISHNKLGFVSHQAFIAKTGLIKQLRGFNTKYKVAADTDLMLKLFSKFETVCIPDELVIVETPKFSSKNHRIARIEIIIIYLKKLPEISAFKGIIYILLQECLNLLNKRLRYKNRGLKYPFTGI